MAWTLKIEYEEGDGRTERTLEFSERPFFSVGEGFARIGDVGGQQGGTSGEAWEPAGGIKKVTILPKTEQVSGL